MNKILNIIKKHYATFTGLFSFIIYIITLAPSVIEIDAGELAAVQATLGIAHPTGYPLFSLAGYLFVNIPSPISKILMSNLLATIWTSLGVMIFTVTAKIVLDNLGAFRFISEHISKSPAKKDKKKTETVEAKLNSPEINEDKKILSCILGGLVLAFSKTFWRQSVSVEVYSLHIFLITLVIFVLIKAYLKSIETHPGDLKYWILFSLALALGFSNHMTTILILPGAAYLYFDRKGFNKLSFKNILVMLLCFFPLLILIYSYLPIRASQNPVINWGNPVDIDRILRHVSGKQYQVWLFSSMDSAKKQLGYFISNFPSEFAIVSLLFIIIGFFKLYFSAKKFLIFIMITFLFTVLYSINYDIVDIDSYFLLGYISISFLSVFGILKLFSLLKSKEGAYMVPISIISVFIALELFINFRNNNQSGNYIYEDYTKNILAYTEKNGIIFSYQWDYFISASYYFQEVEYFRRDVMVIDKELLRRSWYYNQLQRIHPEVMNKLQPYVDPFLKALAPFETDEKFDPVLLEKLYRNLMTHIVTDNIDNHPIYIAPELVENEMARGEFALPKGYFLVPDLFLFRVVRTTDYIPAAKPDFRVRIPQNRNLYTANIQRFMGSMLVRRALYETKFDNADKAARLIKKIKNELPDYEIPYDLLRALE